jgi:hypothetical protein
MTLVLNGDIYGVHAILVAGVNGVVYLTQFGTRCLESIKVTTIVL